MSSSAPPSSGESARRARLKALALLDSEPDALFQSLVETAALMCETPIALVVLADEQRLWFKASVGLAFGETPRAASFCDHVVTNDVVLHVCDASADARFAGQPAVAGPMHVRFYAGAPLRFRDGVVIGTLCVLDRTPRALTPAQSQALEKLASSVIHAIEARDRARAAMVEIDDARARIAQLYRSTPIPLFSMDAQGRLLNVSDAFVTETGFAREQLVGSVLFDLLTPGSRQRALDVGLVFRAAERQESGEYQAIRKDGVVIDILLSHATERASDGRFVRTVGVLENITARRRAERELREESRLNARIIAATDAGTWELDYRTHRTRYNERWAAIIGYTLDELGETTLSTWSSRVHPDDIARVEAAVAAHAEGKVGSYNVECRLRRKDGSWVWIRDHACVTERDAAGRPTILQGVCTDITTQKETEEALRSSRSFLACVGQLAGVGQWSYDLGSRSVTWSAETRRIHGRPADFEPTVREALSHVVPDARQRVERAIAEALAVGEAFDLELPMTDAGGAPFWMRTTGTVEREQGRPVRLIGAVQDITARKLSELEAVRSQQPAQVVPDFG